MGKVWHLQLLGQFCARRGELVERRFGLETSGFLLAPPAGGGAPRHSRDHLAALLWPESTAKNGRGSLRQALAALSRALEPPGIPRGTVLITDRQGIQLNREAVSTDVELFRTACRAAA